MTNWGKFSYKVLIFDCEKDEEELLLIVDEANHPFNIPSGGVVGFRIDSIGHELNGRYVRAVRAYQFNEDYYKGFEPGHKPPKIVTKAWRILQLGNILENE